MKIAFKYQAEAHLNVSSNFPRCFQGIITLILATDMARHGEILDSFKQKVDNFDFTNEEHVTCVSQTRRSSASVALSFRV